MKANPTEIMRLLKTARGQIDGIMKMVEDDQYCIDISHQILASEAILRKINREVLRGHMQSCVKDAFRSESEEEKDKKISEIIGLLEKQR